MVAGAASRWWWGSCPGAGEAGKFVAACWGHRGVPGARIWLRGSWRSHVPLRVLSGGGGRFGLVACGSTTGYDIREMLVRLSTRNQLTGTITGIDVGSVMTVVKIELDGGQQVTASITKDAADDLELKTGMPVTALIKSTEVMLAVE